MPEDEIKRILKDIEEQGFPLEVKASEFLEARGWEVTNQAAYTDYEKRKQRTVDIVADKNILLTHELAFDVHMVVECKKSTNPWVFYASDFDLNKTEIRRKAVSSSQFLISTLAYQEKSDERVLSLINEFLLQNHLMSPIFGKLAHIPFEPFTGGQGRNIHKAQMQVCNAILHSNRGWREWKEEPKYAVPYGAIFIPIIVLEGHLYTYENEKLGREPGLYYYVTYANSAFMFEIMIESFLNIYLDTVEEQIKNFQAKHGHVA